MIHSRLIKMFSVCLIVLGGGILCLTTSGQTLPSDAVHVIQLNDDTINPITAEYITDAIDRAAAENAQCLIIKLDTPGGLLNSTRLIVKKIMSSKVPVVVYISPSGSRAGSAGVFITYASHIAAMAPSTNIGAAHPVQMGQDSGKKQDMWDGVREMLKEKAEGTKTDKNKAGDEELTPDENPMESKILQDTVAFVRSLAEKRGRNEEWAVKAVTKSSSITDKEALELGVVELIAESDADLLAQLDGRTVEVGEQTLTLATKGALVKVIDMDARQSFFNILANPNIAYILMILGFYGLLYEVTHPGFGVPGIMGIIFLILAFYSMQTLPTNYAGLGLVILGLVLFVTEAMTPGFGVWVLGGVIAMVLGSLLLFDADTPSMRVSLSVILGFTLTTAAITVFLLNLAVRAHKRKAMGAASGMLNEKGEARTAMTSGGKGKIFIHGEIWNAVAEDAVNAGETVQVTGIEGLTLKVKKGRQ